MHEKRFDGDITLLRSPERVEKLEVARVVGMCLESCHAESVLDVGTGTGLFAESFARHDLMISGVDINQEMLVIARAFVPKGNFCEASAEALPYPDSFSDIIFLGLVLHESDEPLKVIKEALRVTRKRICILEWPYRDQTFGPPIAHRLNPEYLVGLFKKAGFLKWERTDLSDIVLYLLEVQSGAV